ncbi:hypothetical protein AtNW77_Chr3g0180391 [Arabidopsis thaliana]|uniref:Uncharacterized protein n=2 Tax=Arabidopsis thaliana TaxID=3702 RepID=A0A654FA95_ARATH|nr:uncharacterized protein AT3G21405 [Arabidopsis thaliana]ANM65217.1 hypothetical protein AT3G21405 [Arabidopsis thaliana]CAA0383200.1 unnamed protein product [Arabidopsis thaliana]VYS58130.1 unnamed protein product [Arabidopsis thaliana]|eukprot:NP_001327203.1 hypothetical protein AT3G21405 [Arabidopsis thaliana]
MFITVKTFEYPNARDLGFIPETPSTAAVDGDDFTALSSSVGSDLRSMETLDGDDLSTSLIFPTARRNC